MMIEIHDRMNNNNRTGRLKNLPVRLYRHIIELIDQRQLHKNNL
jgi:hypothetical protein